MKCDKLEEWYAGQFSSSARVYGALDVTEAIAELKARITDLEGLNHNLCERVTENDGIRQHWEEIEQTRAENERLKAKLDRAIAERDGNQVCIDALKQKLESVQASMYADVVDANMENRRLKRALWLARAERAKEHVWHEVSSDGKPLDDYKGQDWVLVQLKDDTGHELIPRIAEYRINLQRWAFIDEDYDTMHSHTMQNLRERCKVIGWRVIDPSYRGRKFYVQNEMDKKVERLCRTKVEEYK